MPAFRRRMGSFIRRPFRPSSISLQCSSPRFTHGVKMTGAGVSSAFLLLLTMASACLITNCPRGGKRSGARPPPSGTTEELPFCTVCGPAERGGLCFGPTMCCSPLGGCEVGGPHTTACLGMQAVPPLCRIPPQSLPAPTETAARCGAGVCTASGVCCTPEWCRADERCLTTEISSNVNLVVAEHNLRQGPQQADFNEWHSADNTDHTAPQYHI